MRGEDYARDPRFRYHLETPPHAWGRHFINLNERIKLRNTPTCVGKTTVKPTQAARV